MNSTIDQLAGKATLALSGLTGTKIVLPLDVDKIVTSANMKNDAYTIDAQPAFPSRITLSHTAVGAADTLGTVVIVGTLVDGTVIQETLTPVAASTVSTINEFATITSVTGIGWVIGEGNDTITVGIGAVIPDSYYFEAISNRIVASADMKVGAYTIAAQPYIPSKITLKHTATDTVDTLGTVVLIGNDVDNRTITETLTPVSGATVTSTYTYKDLISVTGAGWVIDGTEGSADKIEVGTAAVSKTSGYFISGLHVVSAAVVAAQTAQSGYLVADLTDITSLPVGFYPTRLTSVELTSGEAIAYLSRL